VDLGLPRLQPAAIPEGVLCLTDICLVVSLHDNRKGDAMTRRLIILVLIAMTTLLAGSAVTSANDLRISDRDVYFIWNALSERITFGGLLETECNLTLLGHLDESTIPKTPNPIGDIDHAELGECEPAPASRLLANFPWDITYQSFDGRLPTIGRVRLLTIGMAILMNFGAFAMCLFVTTSGAPTAGEAVIGAGSTVTGFDLDQDEDIPLTDLPGFSFLCRDNESFLNGTGDVENGGGADIDITLI
jgi:hypothetical protein